jgi:hypothetical protein
MDASFVMAMPESVQAAAQGLPGVRDVLAEVTASAAVPTTGDVATVEDEVSAGVAASQPDCWGLRAPATCVGNRRGLKIVKGQRVEGRRCPGCRHLLSQGGRKHLLNAVCASSPP